MSSFLIMFIGLAMVSRVAQTGPMLTNVQGELASAMPTSGGLYFWTHRLSDPEYRNFLAWLVGCRFICFHFTCKSDKGRQLFPR
jgi:amino acid transporter